MSMDLPAMLRAARLERDEARRERDALAARLATVTTCATCGRSWFAVEGGESCPYCPAPDLASQLAALARWVRDDDA